MSDKPINGYNYDRLADDIRVVADTLRLDNFALAGHSTGGAIAVRYVARYGGCGVSGLVLMNDGPFWEEGDKWNRLLREIYRLTVFQLKRIHPFVSKKNRPMPRRDYSQNLSANFFCSFGEQRPSHSSAGRIVRRSAIKSYSRWPIPIHRVNKGEKEGKGLPRLQSVIFR